MRFSSRLSMTTDHDLAGSGAKHQWDLSFLDPDTKQRVETDGAARPRKTSTDERLNGHCLAAIIHHRRDCFVPHSPSSIAPPARANGGGGTGKTFPVDGTVAFPGVTMLELGLCKLPHQPSEEQSQIHVYENGGLQQLDDADDIVLVDQTSRLTLGSDDASPRCFLLPVLHSPRGHGVNAIRCNIPWLTVTVSGSEADTESRSQSISSQDSSDQEIAIRTRVRDDSGVGMVWAGDALPRRNSSAPALNDLNVVVCRPSPSPIIDFRNETPIDLRKIDNGNVDESSWVSCLPMADDAPSHDAYTRIARFLPSWDLERLSIVFHRLNLCRFYLGKVSFDEAKVLLRGFPVGTFLLRDSSDSRFLFTLSVQTTRGTTSIRVIYEAGHFRLDCEPEQVHLMPTFDCVIRLIQHYVGIASTYNRRGLRNNFVFLESSGRKDTPVLLRMPYANHPAPLKHMCRLRINGILRSNSVDRLQLIPSLKTFLRDYPYDV